jgi:hypothetical protein
MRSRWYAEDRKPLCTHPVHTKHATLNKSSTGMPNRVPVSPGPHAMAQWYITFHATYP